MKLACTSMLLCLATIAHADKVCVTPNTAIPDNNASGVSIPIEVNVGPSQIIDSLEVALDIAHPWVGDLVISLESPDGSIVTLLDRPGIPSTGFPGPFGCGGRDLDAVFSDAASTPAEGTCSYAAVPVIAGMVVPNQPLAVFIGQPADGTWLLNVSDRSAYDAGVVIGVCIDVTTGSLCTPDLTGDGVLDFFDVSAFLNAFTSMDPLADFTGDGQFNFFDVSAFLNAYSAGCP